MPLFCDNTLNSARAYARAAGVVLRAAGVFRRQHRPRKLDVCLDERLLGWTHFASGEQARRSILHVCLHSYVPTS